MNQYEPPLTEGFWRAQGLGTYIKEYPLVKRASDRGNREADAVILPSEPFRIAHRSEYPTLEGLDVIVVQTKNEPMSFDLLCQAVFSPRLVMAQRAKSVRSILLCRRSDAALFPLLQGFSAVEVWITDPQNPTKC